MAAILLTNNLGSYFLSGFKSRYSGWFYFNKDMFKIIDSFEGDANISMPNLKNSLVCGAKDWIEIFFDVKTSYDKRKWGRLYSVKKEKNSVILRFTKKTDSREDKIDGKKEFTLYVAVTGFDGYAFTRNWVLREYSFDLKRNSLPFERYVYSAFRLKGRNIVFSVNENKEKAVKEANFIFKNLENIRRKQKKINALEQLIVYNKEIGIFAGLPWFFQFWTRDELVSLKALILSKRINDAKKIFFEDLELIQKDGRLLNIRMPKSKITNADSVGWLFLRANDIWKYLNDKEKRLVKEKLIYSINRIEENYYKGFILNNQLETWMDTVWDDDTRKGFCIEIQALFLNMLKFAFKLTKNNKYSVMETEIKERVKNEFFDGNFLYDTNNDKTIRPNIFIAAYTYPELLTKNEWSKCFDNALKGLWLEWGGLSTIDKNSPLFCKNHTGEIPQSYHRGDSWFWLNNLAAIVMHRIDKVKFKKYINKIKKVSTKETKETGIIGQSAELSSASELRSEGCLAQTWSNAMYIELINELKPK